MMAFIVPKSAVSTTKPTVKELPVRLPPALANRFLMSSVRADMQDYIKQRLEFYAKEIKSYRKVVEHWLNYHESVLKTRQERASFNTYKKNLKIMMRSPDRMFDELATQVRDYERAKLNPSIPPLERREFRNALSAVKNIKLKVRGEALGTVLSKRRSECAEALALYCKPDQIMKESLSKTLFFASSVLPVVSLERHLRKLGFEPLLVYAGTNSNLTANIDAFTDDPNINPICATMQSLSEAVPVIAASTIVLLNRPFRQATWDQVVARADRLGQVHPVTIIEVTLDTGSEPNVSSSTDAILATVRELINSIVGPDFAGPDPDEREYKDLIDASTEDPEAGKKVDDL
jgi:SNF2 family DNA or RNA helicase